MMPIRCEEFDRWLDEGMPSRHSVAASAHAEGCARCTAALAAAHAVEAALREPPPLAPAAMADFVMERVERTERARLRHRETERARPWSRWLGAFAEEPAAAVALALAPVFLIVVVAWPETARAVALLVHEAMAAWIATVASGAATSASGLSGLAPQTRSMIDFVLLPALLMLALMSFLWIGEAMRPLRSPRSRESQPPTSR